MAFCVEFFLVAILIGFNIKIGMNYLLNENGKKKCIDFQIGNTKENGEIYSMSLK